MSLTKHSIRNFGCVQGIVDERLSGEVDEQPILVLEMTDLNGVSRDIVMREVTAENMAERITSLLETGRRLRRETKEKSNKVKGWCA